MLNYDINVDVKYKRIEKELLENFQDKELDTSKLSKENLDRALDEDYNEED